MIRILDDVLTGIRIAAYITLAILLTIAATTPDTTRLHYTTPGQHAGGAR